jgi:hypothetical protein
MKLQHIVTLAAAALGLANPAFAQDAGKPMAAKSAAVARAMDNAMTPGDYQKRLEPMIGSFDVRVLIWVDPGKPPIESSASAVSVWVLGNRFVQTMLVGGPSADAFNAIGYIGYDNAAKQYQAAWMDDGSTAMTLYTGGFSADGKSATMKASITNASTGKPTPLELRMSLGANGGHVTQLWGMGFGTKMFKMMELQYTRTKP